MDVVVLGAGSLGSLIGGLLAREHDVILVGRDPHVERVASNGLAIEGRIEARVAPAATTDGTGLRADLAVVTVKAFDTASAARTLETGSYDAVLSLQNGMGNEETLAARLSCPILAGTVTYGAILEAPGRVTCTGTGEVVLGSWTGDHSPLAERVGRVFATAGVETTIAADMPRRLWRKLAVNAGINPVTALARVENGAVLDLPTASLASDAALETARVARAHGIDLSDDEAVETLESVAAATADNRSSMLQDVQSDSRTEIDAISGYVLERATEADVSVPTTRTLTDLLRTWERGRGLR